MHVDLQIYTVRCSLSTTTAEIPTVPAWACTEHSARVHAMRHARWIVAVDMFSVELHIFWPSLQKLPCHDRGWNSRSPFLKCSAHELADEHLRTKFHFISIVLPFFSSRLLSGRGALRYYSSDERRDA